MTGDRRPDLSFFFYGTLRDADVRRRLLQRDLPAATVMAAELPDFAVRHVRGAVYPMLLAQRGSRAAGLLAAGLSRREARVLDRFEGDGYRRVSRTVRAADGSQVAAEVYLPRPGMRADIRPWDFAHWQRHDKAGFLRRAFGG